jgi:hypothetical protein
MVRSAAAMPSLSHAPWRASSLPKPCRARGHDRFPGLERDAFRAPAARDGRQVRGDRARATRQGRLRRTPSRKSGESSRRSGLPTLRNHRPAAAQGMSSPASKKAIETGASARRPLLEVLLVFLRLGLTSFGGPVAHLGYFQGEFVERRKWLDEAAYVDIVALCQFLPGPASSQVGITLGTLRAGLPGLSPPGLGSPCLRRSR